MNENVGFTNKNQSFCRAIWMRILINMQLVIHLRSLIHSELAYHDYLLAPYHLGCTNHGVGYVLSLGVLHEALGGDSLRVLELPRMGEGV